MEVKRVIMVLADISGYTSFMKLHRTSLIHAEIIITDLIESVLASAKHPMTINKLEGDAVFFYAEIDEKPREVAGSVLDQLMQFFDVFHDREQQIVSCNLCQCDACLRAEDLRLKVIAHSGEALIKQVSRFEELAGEDVILIHRLLKNSVTANEYLLLTDAFSELLDEKPHWNAQALVETYDILGDVPVTVYFPYADSAPIPQLEYKATIVAKLWQLFRYEGYLLGRWLGFIKPQSFHNLPDVGR